MRIKRNQNQIWLFSFADLAFLLLIAFTQASTIGKKPINIGEMVLPKVVDGPNIERLQGPVKLYQIRVHKPRPDTAGPFQLVAVSEADEESAGALMSARGLENTLVALHRSGLARPVLVPDESSWSRDMLLAMSLVEKIWTTNRTVTVETVREIPEEMP